MSSVLRSQTTAIEYFSPDLIKIRCFHSFWANPIGNGHMRFWTLHATGHLVSMQSVGIDCRAVFIIANCYFVDWLHVFVVQSTGEYPKKHHDIICRVRGSMHKQNESFCAIK